MNGFLRRSTLIHGLVCGLQQPRGTASAATMFSAKLPSDFTFTACNGTHVPVGAEGRVKSRSRFTSQARGLYQTPSPYVVAALLGFNDDILAKVNVQENLA